MIELVTERLIDAPRDAVWAILADFAKYPQWNPYIRAIGGALQPGARLAVTAAPPGGPPRTFHPVVTGFEAGRTFRWAWAMGHPAVFIGEHIFELEDSPGGGTRLVHREEFSGLITPLHGLVRLEVTRRGFEAMNEALARRALS